MKIIPKPCKAEVERYLEKWNSTEKIMLHDRSLKILFKEEFPENKQMEHILIKANTLNDFYSAGVFDKEIIPLTKHIYELNIDKRLKDGDLTLVKDIMNTEGVRKVYSFATKYCSHHNPKDFPIFDSYVKKVLIHFRNENPCFNFKNDDLMNYPKYKEILEDFQEKYNLGEFNLKQLDMYLWQLGKDYY